MLANDLAKGYIHIGNYGTNFNVISPFRFGTYVTSAFLIKIFGLSEWTLVAFPFFISIVSCLLAYSLAAHFFGRLVLHSNRHMRQFPPNIPMIAGLCFGISWLSKETVAYLAPVLVIYYRYILKLRPLTAYSNLLYVGLGGLIVIAAEAGFYRAFSGDWLFHFHELERNYTVHGALFFDQSSPLFGWPEGGYVKALVKRLFYTGPTDLLNSFGYLPSFAIVSLAWATVIRDRRFITVGSWFVVLMLMFNFGSSSLMSYKPLPLMFRHYLYPILLPATVVVSGTLAALLERKTGWDLTIERRFWAATLVVAYIIFCVPGVNNLRRRPDQVTRDVVPLLSASDIVYTDVETAGDLVFFRTGKLLPYDDATIAYEGLAIDDMRAGSYVLVNKDTVDFLAKENSNYTCRKIVITSHLRSEHVTK